MNNIKIYSIVYSPEQVVEYEKYDNSHIKSVQDKSYLFEYNVLLDIVDNYNVQEEYLGIFSHKFPLKTGVFKKKLFWLLDNNPKYDVYGFCPQRLKGQYLSFTEKTHPGFSEIFYPLCKDLGLEVKEPKHVIYGNFFIAKSEIYRLYVQNIVKPAIQLMETKYKEQVWKDSNYKGLSKEQLKQLTGLDYYPFQTFLLERMASLYFESMNFRQLI